MSLKDLAGILTTAPQCHGRSSMPEVSCLIQKSVDVKNQEQVSRDANLVWWRRERHLLPTHSSLPDSAGLSSFPLFRQKPLLILKQVNLTFN